MIFKKKEKNKFYSILFLILSIGLFFVSFEEISWGQRIIGIETPESLKEINNQNEINIHNLLSYNVNEFAYILVGFYGIFSDKIIKIFFKNKKKIFNFFIIPKHLFFYFFFLFLVYSDRRFINFNYDVVINNTFRKYAVWDWLEVAELYLAIAFFVYTKITYKGVQNNLLNSNNGREMLKDKIKYSQEDY